jgi:predicted secreted Zn-dependent protease
MRFRYVTPTKKGRWKPSLEEAWEAAVAAGVAHKDDHGRIFLDVFTEIETAD